MTIADTSSSTVSGLFFSQVRNLTMNTARKKSRSYDNELLSILDNYAPETSKLLRAKLFK